MYKYKVYGHDGIKSFIETGIVLGSTFEEASRNLSDYYDEDDLTKIALIYTTDDLVIPLNESIVKEIVNSIV